jgi:hypothetical protein
MKSWTRLPRTAKSRAPVRKPANLPAKAATGGYRDAHVARPHLDEHTATDDVV